MKCFNCKEEISEKFKHALSQNVCPFCGRGIFSAIDFHFRKSIVGILNKNGIVSETVVLGIINDIEDLVRAPEPTTQEEAEVKQMIQNGELVFSGVVDTSGARKLPIRIGGKPIPRPITRAS